MGRPCVTISCLATYRSVINLSIYLMLSAGGLLPYTYTENEDQRDAIKFCRSCLGQKRQGVHPNEHIELAHLVLDCIVTLVVTLF